MPNRFRPSGQVFRAPNPHHCPAASGGHRIMGHDGKLFIAPPAEALHCANCSDILDNPVQCPKGHTFCQAYPSSSPSLSLSTHFNPVCPPLFFQNVAPWLTERTGMPHCAHSRVHAVHPSGSPSVYVPPSGAASHIPLPTAHCSSGLPVNLDQKKKVMPHMPVPCRPYQAFP